MSTDTTRRDRRIAAKKKHILDAAAQVFLEKGFQRATTKDIAEAADIAEGTIYNYFTNKEELALAFIGQIADLDQRMEYMERGLDLDPAAFFEQYFITRMTAIEGQYPALLAILPDIIANPSLRQGYHDSVVKPALTMLEDHLRARVERGQLREVDAALLTRALAALVVGLQILTLINEQGSEKIMAHPQEYTRPLVDMLIEGVRRR